MTQELYLLRHANAEPWSPLGNDFSRTLSRNGNRAAGAVAKWMHENVAMPDTVLCSPAKRTRETAAPVLAGWPQLLSSTEYPDAMYGASLSLLLTLAQDAFSYCDRVMMVGHNPGLQYLLMNAIREEQAVDIDKMATSTLAVIGFPSGFKAHGRHGELQHLVRGTDLSVN